MRTKKEKKNQLLKYKQEVATRKIHSHCNRLRLCENGDLLVEINASEEEEQLKLEGLESHGYCQLLLRRVPLHAYDAEMGKE